MVTLSTAHALLRMLDHVAFPRDADYDESMKALTELRQIESGNTTPGDGMISQEMLDAYQAMEKAREDATASRKKNGRPDVNAYLTYKAKEDVFVHLAAKSCEEVLKHG